jgi:hypothetical protein
MKLDQISSIRFRTSLTSPGFHPGASSDIGGNNLLTIWMYYKLKLGASEELIGGDAYAAFRRKSVGCVPFQEEQQRKWSLGARKLLALF